MLNLKMIPPSYRLVKGESIVPDTSKKGKLLFEFTPRSGSGSYSWPDQVRFALSAEEAGLVCSQLPSFPVEFSRNQAHSQDDDPASLLSVMTSDMPDKVLTISPGEGSTVVFVFDYVRDGVGNQSPGGGRPGVS